MSRQIFATATLLLLAAVPEISPSPVKIEYTITEVIQSCSSPIYCQGELLDVIQKAELFDDSKTFVDMSQLNSVNVTLENFCFHQAQMIGWKSQMDSKVHATLNIVWEPWMANILP